MPDTCPRPPTADAVAAFFHPDYTVGPGLTPGLLTCPAHKRRTPLAGLVPKDLTAGRESHPALKAPSSPYQARARRANRQRSEIFHLRLRGVRVQAEALSNRMYRPWQIGSAPRIACEQHILTDVLDPIEVEAQGLSEQGRAGSADRPRRGHSSDDDGCDEDQILVNEPGFHEGAHDGRPTFYEHRGDV